jgi:hypothetical protein
MNILADSSVDIFYCLAPMLTAILMEGFVGLNSLSYIANSL